MLSIRSILCPVDRSDISRHVLKTAAALARRQHASLHVIEVADVSLPPLSGDESALFLLSPDDRAALTTELRLFAADAAGDVPLASCELIEGAVAREVLRSAADRGVDLIVIGTHGRGGFEHLALGSVAEKVLRKAHCLVLTVPPAQKADAIVPFHHLVWATDFSPSATRALSVAREWATEFGAACTGMCVIEWPFGQVTGHNAVTELAHSIERDSREQLARALDGLPKADVAIAYGKPGHEIAGLARAKQADLIVMGITGRTAIGLAVLGSTTHRVLREAPCPVLTVRGE